jgi:hypothetical protein
MPLEHDEEFFCPYCGQSNPLVVDISGGRNQSFVVDCEVCCAPIAVRLKISGGEIITLDVRKENE